LPDEAGEDSFSLLPLLQGSDQPIRSSAVNTACNGLPSYREGAWKYVATAVPELYHLDDDPAESVNLAQTQPERLQEMQAAFEKIIRAGRSTPGAPGKNDVRVVRYPKASPVK
jgi:arylsulfatase A